MYYKQAVSGFIYTHHSSSIFHARCLFTLASFYRPFPFSQNLQCPFISVWRWANETHSHSYWWSKRELPHAHTCRKTHVLILNCVSHFSIKKKPTSTVQMKNLSIPLSSLVLRRPSFLTVGYTLLPLYSSLILPILERLLKYMNFKSLNSQESSLLLSLLFQYQLLNSVSCQSLHFPPPTYSFSLLPPVSFTNTHTQGCFNLPPIIAGGKEVAKIQNSIFSNTEMLRMRTHCDATKQCLKFNINSLSANPCDFCADRHCFLLSVSVTQYVKALTVAVALATTTAHAESWKMSHILIQFYCNSINY